MIKLVCVGRLKERFCEEGAGYYAGRFQSGSLSIIEVPDESAPERLSEAQKRKIMEKEGEALLKEIAPGEAVVALDAAGAKYSEAEIRAVIRKHNGNLAFVIGGSLGLGSNALARADYKWSLSPMTLPHQLARAAVAGALAQSLVKTVKTENPVDKLKI